MRCVLLLAVTLLCASLVSAALPSQAQLEAVATQVQLNLPSTSAPSITCQQCVSFISAAVVNSTLQSIITACHNTSSPFYPHCPFIRDHPQFFLGYMVASLHPVVKAAYFCLGAGYCPADSQPQSLPSPASSITLLAAQARASTVDAPPAPEWCLWDETAVASVKEEPVTTSRFTSLARLLTWAAPQATCKECVQHFIVKQLEDVLAAVKAYCVAHKNDPQVVKRCTAIKDNIPYATGVIYANRQPQKFAAGVCVGAGVCGTEQHAESALETVVM